MTAHFLKSVSFEIGQVALPLVIGLFLFQGASQAIRVGVIQDATAGPGQLPGAGGAHRPATDDDNILRSGHLYFLRNFLKRPGVRPDVSLTGGR